jgi:serine/threonine protein kinase
MLNPVVDTSTDPQDPQEVPAARAQTETSDLITPLEEDGAAALTETSDLLTPLVDSDSGTQTATSSPSGSSMGGGGDDPLLPDGSSLELESGVELRVERILGRGGMGVVYLVQDPRLGRQAALKLVRDSSNETRVRRFRREAEITAHLDHPGIPPVFESGRTASGQDYLLLRYVKGKSLAERLTQLAEKRQRARQRGEVLPVPRGLLEALARVGEAVAYAHSRGIVHRDLKPDNVMIGAFGEVLVMDWGLARDFREDADSAFLAKSDPGEGAPAGGPLLGTLGYMAPEQARREEVDARADIYALGAILTEILSGEPPVRLASSTALQVLERTRAGDLERPAARNPRVPLELDAIAATAAAASRAQRYGTAEAFSADVRAYLRGRRVSAYDYRPIDRFVRGVKRHTTWVVAAAFLLLTLVSVIHARGSAQRAQAAEARLDAARAWAALREVHPSDRDEWLSQAWAALTAAQQWHQLDPDALEAAEARFRAAFALGDAALNQRQWSLARQAYLQAVGLGVDDARAANAVERVDAARAEAESGSRQAVLDLLDGVERGELGVERGILLELALEVAREASALADAGLLIERLEPISAALKRAQHDVLVEVREPDAAEQARGEGELAGLGITVTVWESEGLLGSVDSARMGELQAAWRRVEDRAQRAGVPGTWLEVVARRQLDDVGEARLRLAWVLSEALGQLSRPEATPALARYLWFEAEPTRAAAAGRALVRLGEAELAQGAVGRRFPPDGVYAQSIERARRAR